MDMFATVECTLQMVLWKYAKIPDSTARAILSGVRVDNAMSFINRLIEVDDPGPEIKADLKDVFQQLSIINGARNNIIHYGAVSSEGDDKIITNAYFALTESRVREFPVSPQIFSDLVVDLQKIMMHFVTHHLNEVDMADVMKAQQEKILRAAWRYKPPQQSQNRQTTQ